MKNKIKLMFIFLVVIALTGCDSTSTTVSINLTGVLDSIQTPLFGGSQKEESAPDALFDASFPKTQEDFIEEFKNNSHLKGVKEVTETNPRVESDAADDMIKHYRYSFPQRVILNISTRTEKEKESITSIELSQSFKEPSPDFLKYEKALLEVMLKPESPELLEELLEHQKYPIGEAERSGYGQSLFQYDDVYVYFKANDKRKTTLSLVAVTTEEKYIPYSYFDGENYHLYEDDNGKLRHHTKEDLFVIASEFYKGLQGEKLPKKLMDDLPEEYKLFIKEETSKLPESSKDAENEDETDTDEEEADSSEDSEIPTKDDEPVAGSSVTEEEL